MTTIKLHNHKKSSLNKKSHLVSSFSTRAASLDSYGWTLGIKTCLTISLTLNHVAQTSRYSLLVKNQSDHYPLERVFCHDCSTGLCDKAKQAGSTLAQSEKLQSICHGVIWGKGILPRASTAPGMRGCMEPIAELVVIPLGWLMRSAAQCLMCLIWAADEAVTQTEPNVSLTDEVTCGGPAFLTFSRLLFSNTVQYTHTSINPKTIWRYTLTFYHVRYCSFLQQPQL